MDVFDKIFKDKIQNVKDDKFGGIMPLGGEDFDDERKIHELEMLM